MKKLVLVALFLFGASGVKAQAMTDEEAVIKAIFNYVDSFYKADTSKVYESVHPALAKRGYYKRENAYREATMSFQQMVSLSAKWNKTNPVPPDAPKEITIFEIKDKIASAKVKAQWGTDYFHLVKENGNWKIMNVLWQD